MESDFNLPDDHLRECFLLPHSVELESYVKALQCKVLNNILYTNKKVFKIGYNWSDDVCSFCEAEPEISNAQGNFGTILNLTGASYQNIIFGIISKQCPITNLLNYFIIVGKLFLWDCIRNQIHPKIKSYQNKVARKVWNWK